MKISLIVSTYNRPDALNLVLQGIANQSLGQCLAVSDVEVLIADDGSRQETAALVQSWQSHFPFTLQHVWHEDIGFRLAAIRNRAAAQARGSWLVFIDGDCVPLPDFLAKQWELAEPGFAVAGNRLLLSETWTRDLCQQGNCPALQWRLFDWWQAWRAGVINKPTAWLRLPNFWRKLRSKNWRIIKGCNIGVWREDYQLVNGFDESFSGWGYEDSDFAVRLLRLGRNLKDGRFAVPLLHLWHKENDRSQEPENLKRLHEILTSNRIRAVKGFSQY